jgi:hypothetical protein
MPKKDAVQRMESYVLKLNPERVKQDLEKRQNGMLNRQREAIVALTDIEAKVKAVLASEDIPTILYVYYYDFARETFRLQRRLGGGNGLSKEVTLLIYKWKERTLQQRVLERIRDEVFSIPVMP